MSRFIFSIYDGSLWILCYIWIHLIYIAKPVANALIHRLQKQVYIYILIRTPRYLNNKSLMIHLVILFDFLAYPISNNWCESYSRRKSYGWCSFMCSICQCKSPHFFSSFIRWNPHLHTIINIQYEFLTFLHGWCTSVIVRKLITTSNIRADCIKNDITFCNNDGTSTPALMRA